MTIARNQGVYAKRITITTGYFYTVQGIHGVMNWMHYELDAYKVLNEGGDYTSNMFKNSCYRWHQCIKSARRSKAIRVLKPKRKAQAQGARLEVKLTFQNYRFLYYCAYMSD